MYNVHRCYRTNDIHRVWSNTKIIMYNYIKLLMDIKINFFKIIIGERENHDEITVPKL